MREIFFTIVPRKSGFTDQLNDFRAFHKLGISLGYTYWHQPFFSARSANIDGHGRPMGHMSRTSNRNKKCSFMQKVYYKVKRQWLSSKKSIDPPTPFNVFDFLGLNPYFLGYNRQFAIDELEIVDLSISSALMEELRVENILPLRQYVHEQVGLKLDSTKTIMVQFMYSDWKVDLSNIIQDSIADQIDLRELYMEQRRREPWPSIFPDANLKTMIHIRQGDTAVIDTPWNSYITTWPLNYLEEYEKWEDIPYQDRLIKVSDFYHVYQSLVAQFPKNTFGTLLFSDGFIRAERRFHNQKERLNLTPQQIMEVQTALQTFDEEKFRLFEDIDNLQMLIGEEPEKLQHFIHSFLTADLVVVGRQQRMILKLLVSYYQPENMPVIVALNGSNDQTKIREELEAWVGKRMLENFVIVNVGETDYFPIANEVRKLLEKNGKQL